MRIANLRGRLCLLDEQGALDVAEASGGRFGPDPSSLWSDWDRFRDWASGVAAKPSAAYPPDDLGPPVPRPSQVFAIGLNYRDHAEESGLGLPTEPSTFTKFPCCITGPFATVELPGEHVDYEVELVVVIGREARKVAPRDSWSFVAGVMVGQDISERDVQLRPLAPQFSLGKSFPGFGPTGPAIVTVDELANPDDLALGCSIGDETLQSSRTSKMVFSVPEIISRLSKIVTLRAGDVIFTGTPAGVGIARKPQRWLRPGDVLESWVDGVGRIRQKIAAASA